MSSPREQNSAASLPPPQHLQDASSSSLSSEGNQTSEDFLTASAQQQQQHDQQPHPSNIPTEEQPPPDADDDSGIIRCICGISDDDGFTIQCDRCLVWQHCACFGMSSQSVPDEYLCEQCEPRDVNVAYAQAHQQRRREQEARKAKAEKTFHDRRQSETRSPATPAGLQRSSLPALDEQQAIDTASPTDQPLPSPASRHPPLQPQPPRSRKPSQSLDLSNTSFVAPDAPASAGVGSTSGTANVNATKPPRKKPGPKPGSRKTPLTTPTITTPASATTPRGYAFPPTSAPPMSASNNTAMTPREEKPEEDSSFLAEKQLEAWHFDFTPITRSLLGDPRVLDILAAASIDYDQGSPLQAQEIESGHHVVSLGSQEIDADSIMPDDGAATAASPHHLPATSEAMGLSAIGNECVPIEIHTPSLDAIASSLYVRPISETASAAIFANVQYIDPLPTEPARPWAATRVFSRPVMHGLFAEDPIPAGAFITEFRGELLSAEKYRSDPINQYYTLGATKPHVHMFPPPLGLAIDARRFGTEARFARYGCHPNAVLRPILHYPTAAKDDSQMDLDKSRSSTPGFTDIGAGRLPGRGAAGNAGEPELLFGLFALRDISRNHELILGWEWDDQHIVHFLPELVRNPALEIPGEDRAASAVEMAGKGDFPYASRRFSDKMNVAMTSLLGTALCSCIGSATPQSGSGGGSASSHNARKQDCAVAQMLRVGQGMSLMNVNIPGMAKHSQRRPRPPDFGPVVGVQRWWRPLSMPPTPFSSPEDMYSSISHENLSVRERMLNSHDLPGSTYPGGKVARVMEDDLQRLIAKEAEEELAAAEAELMHVQSQARRRSAFQVPSRMTADLDDADADSVDDDRAQDSDSDVSSLTEPLSGLSDIETDDDDSMLLRGIPDEADLPGDDSRDHDSEGSSSDAPSVLPLKKRVAGTRLKANHLHGGDPDREDKTNRRNAKKAERAAATIKAREAKQAKRRVIKAARKLPSHARGKVHLSSRASPRRHPGLDESSDESDHDEEERQDQDDHEVRKAEDGDETAQDSTRKYRKKQRKASTSSRKNPILPSSPLTSAPEDDSLDDSDDGKPADRRRPSFSRAGINDSEDEEDVVSTPTDKVLRVQDKKKPRRRSSAALSEPRAADEADDPGARPSGLSKRKKEAKRAKKADKRRNELAALADTESSDSAESESPRPRSKKRKMSVVQEEVRSKSGAVGVHDSDDSAQDDERKLPSARQESESRSSATPKPSGGDAEVEGSSTPIPGHDADSSAIKEEPVAEPSPVPEAPKEPEKPRAKLSLADWKRQQAEKRKVAAAEVTSSDVPAERSDQAGDGSSSAASTAPKVEPLKISTSLPPPPPMTSPPTATPSSSVMPSAVPPKASLPPAPLPSRTSDSGEVGAAPPQASSLGSTASTATTATATTPASASVDRSVSLMSPPLPSRVRGFSLTGPPPAPLPPPTTTTTSSTSSSSSALSPTAATSALTASTVPTHAVPAAPLPIPVRPGGPRVRAPSVSTIGAPSAKSPPTGPSALTGNSPPQHAMDSGWSGRSSTSSFRPPAGRWSVSGPSADQETSGVSVTSPVKKASSPVNTSVAGPSRFAEPPSPRGLGPRPGLPLGPPAAPAAPAALRNSLPSGPLNAGLPSARFNPPKGPKALMNAGGGGAGAATTGGSSGASGSNAISIRSGSVSGVGGSPPLNQVDMPSGPMSYGSSRSYDRSPGSPPQGPTRHVSILGRGAATAAGGTTGEEPGEQMDIDYSPPGASDSGGWDREEGPGPGRGGGEMRWHSGFESHRGHRGHGLPHAPHHFGRGGWGGRGGRGGGGGEGRGGAGWGGRGRGRGGRGGMV